MPTTAAVQRHRLLATVLMRLVAAAVAAFAVGPAVAQDDLDTALARATRAVEAEPRQPQPRFERGVVLMEMRRDDEALAVFTRLTEEFPGLPDPHNNIALLHARGGRLEAARQSLQAALRADPSHPAALANLGQVHLMLAIDAWDRAAAAGALDDASRRRLDAVRAALEPSRASAPRR